MLREYQSTQLNYRLNHYQENVCIQSPTGSGKSKIIESELLYNLATEQKTLVLVPKQELTYNIARYIPDHSTVAYSGYTPELDRPIFVCTYQSALKYAEKYNPHRIISDECHGLTKGGLWSKVIDRLQVPHTGYTATPNRLDGQGLYSWFSHLSTTNQISWFIDNQYLSPFKLFTASSPSFTESTDALDIQSLLFIPKIKDTVRLWLDTAYGKKTIAFTTTTEHSKLLKKEFIDNGILAEIVDHRTPLKIRNHIVSQYKKGFIKVLINVNLFTEGVDMPDVECVLLARFTYSLARYLQMVGRGLRYQLDKVLYILDIANNCFYHGSPSVPNFWSLEGERGTVKTNQESQYINCEKCETPLIHRKFIKSTSNVCCLKCHTVNSVYGFATSVQRKNSTVLHSLISVDKLHQIDDDTITQLSRIVINKKLKIDEKINLLMTLDIDIEILEKILIHIGIRKSEIQQFLDDVIQ